MSWVETALTRRQEVIGTKALGLTDEQRKIELERVLNQKWEAAIAQVTGNLTSIFQDLKDAGISVSSGLVDQNHLVDGDSFEYLITYSCLGDTGEYRYAKTLVWKIGLGLNKAQLTVIPRTDGESRVKFEKVDCIGERYAFEMGKWNEQMLIDAISEWIVSTA